MVQEKFSILLVDDDPMVVRILNLILKDFAPLRFSTTGRGALKLAHESVPDLVLLDVDMPGLSGFETCEAFKSDSALVGVPIIFLSSYESPQLEAAGLKLGAADFIRKPPQAPLILARVRTYQRFKTLADAVRGAAKPDHNIQALSRQEWEKALRSEGLRARRSSSPLSVLLADVEGFDAYCAEFGVETADACLKSVADALRLVANRSTDALSCFAGGHFALILPDTGIGGARTVGQRAIDAIDRLHIRHAGGMGRLTLTIGGGSWGAVDDGRIAAIAAGARAGNPADAVPNMLIQAADRSLQRARAAGGHQARCVDIADPEVPFAASSLH